MLILIFGSIFTVLLSFLLCPGMLLSNYMELFQADHCPQFSLIQKYFGTVRGEKEHFYQTICLACDLLASFGLKNEAG